VRRQAGLFLSQIFDYGNTDIEKWAIFFKLLHPLLNFGREREGVDLSALRLTAFTIKDMGKPKLILGAGDAVKIEPTCESGSGIGAGRTEDPVAGADSAVQRLVRRRPVTRRQAGLCQQRKASKLPESEVLIEQARSNSKEQFTNSPDLAKEMLNAIMDALAAHGTMSKQALNSPKPRDEMHDCC
jgi:type I restriction enzyme R subunit